MGTTVKVNLDSVNSILAKRGLEPGGKAQRFMTSEIYRLSMPYTPFDNNVLSTNVTIDANSITYNSLYARYQYYGKVMAGNPRKVTDKDIKYQGSPMRGAKWTERMIIDRSEDIVKEVEDFIKKNSK